MAATSYLIGLGSNRPHGRHGRPRDVVAAALPALAAEGVAVLRCSAIVRTPALGPSARDFANAVALVETRHAPPELLRRLKAIERRFGRRRGRRWGARVLDLDILAWSGGGWPAPPRARSRHLAIPHPAFAKRAFALGLATRIAPDWRLPTGGRLAALEAGRRRPQPVDRRGPCT